MSDPQSIIKNELVGKHPECHKKKTLPCLMFFTVYTYIHFEYVNNNINGDKQGSCIPLSAVQIVIFKTLAGLAIFWCQRMIIRGNFNKSLIFLTPYFGTPHLEKKVYSSFIRRLLFRWVFITGSEEFQQGKRLDLLLLQRDIKRKLSRFKVAYKFQKETNGFHYFWLK